MFNKISPQIGLICLLLGFVSLLEAKTSDEFPARKLYPAVPYIELDALFKKKDKVIIVDVRSKYEYETLRIKGALNISYSESSFVDKMRELQAKNPNAEIIVYCNGKTCKKSYKATQSCRNAGIKNVIAYDAGIMDWAKKYPADSVLLGKSPIDPARLISKNKFKDHLLPTDKFESMVTQKDVIVVDVRGAFQREGVSLFPGLDYRGELDNPSTLDGYIQDANKNNKTLLIYDETGKQVRWLMYYLQDKGLKSYKFMQGGANAYYKALRKKYVR